MRKGLILTGFLCSQVLCLFAVAAETEEKLLGDESDGSRATPLHVIPLYAENEDGEKGEKITPDAEFPMPFSTRWTCLECHNYDIIKQGWHFNVLDSNVPPGRPGEPWIYFDPKLCIQIPLSYRDWPGTYKPEQIGLSAFKLTKIFGRHMPGGGTGQAEATELDDIGRQLVSGKLEINCLACHNAHPGQDMGSVNGYSVQISRENFRWAAAASCEFANVTGSAAMMTEAYDPFFPDPDEKDAPAVTYNKNVFNENNEVLFHIVREAPNGRCYYCHSDLYQNTDEKAEKWTQDEDVHLTAGLKCVDCHRNGIDHNIIRGYPEETGVSQNPLAGTSTCEGCHLPEGSEEPKAGRLGAPVPTHRGIPAVHFDKLTCTACHSGPWPDKQTVLTKTSRAHRLGTPNVSKVQETLPHIISPVFARQRPIGTAYMGELVLTKADKIAPHKMIWPSFWGILEDDKVTPLDLETIRPSIEKVFAELELPATGDWPDLKAEEHIKKVLLELQTVVQGQPVYISGGKVHRIDTQGFVSIEHPAGQPYMWPIAHNVRPAAQSLGVRYCTDCHATDAPFFFGNVAVDSPITDERDSAKKMTKFMGVRPFYTKAFAFSFVFRPWMKYICLGSCAVMAVVLLLYALKALACVVKTLSGNNQ